MTYARRTDANQTEIVTALRKMGCLVAVTSNVGKGFPDLVLGVENKLLMLEIKDGNKPLSAQRLTPDEQSFHATWGEHVTIIRSVDQAVELVRNIRRKNR